MALLLLLLVLTVSAVSADEGNKKKKANTNTEKDNFSNRCIRKKIIILIENSFLVLLIVSFVCAFESSILVLYDCS